VTIRDRSRDLLRAELAQAAVDVLAERGFENTTVEELAHELGISRATFFRYFGGKDDVVVAVVDGPGAGYADALAQASVQTPWTLLRAAFEPAVARSERDTDRLRRRLRMISALPSLQGHIGARRSGQIDTVVAALADRIGDAVTARTLTVAAYAAVDLAWQTWASSDTSSFRAVLDRTFADLGAG
jgi:AcrR family transcriptional regulator